MIILKKMNQGSRCYRGNTNSVSKTPQIYGVNYDTVVESSSVIICDADGTIVKSVYNENITNCESILKALKENQSSISDSITESYVTIDNKSVHSMRYNGKKEGIYSATIHCFLAQGTHTFKIIFPNLQEISTFFREKCKVTVNKQQYEATRIGLTTSYVTSIFFNNSVKKIDISLE